MLQSISGSFVSDGWWSDPVKLNSDRIPSTFKLLLEVGGEANRLPAQSACMSLPHTL